MKKLFLIVLLLSGFMAFYPDTAAETAGYRVIVHAANPTSALTRDQVSDYLLKKRTRWEDDTPIQPIDLDSDSPLRESFSREVHGRSVKHIQTYWNRKIFTGEEVPPPKVGSDREVVDFVRRHRGAIGYVSASAQLSGVKSIEITD